MQRESHPQLLKAYCLSIISILTFLCCTSTTFAADITISENTAWTAGTYTYDNVTITNTATLTLTSNSTTGEGVTLQAINLTIDPGATISASGEGCPRDQGTGAGSYGYWGSGGGGYGGAGGDGRNATGGIGYGSITAPHELGSGGGSSVYTAFGGAGGGIIRIAVSGSLTVDGTISAHGDKGDCYSPWEYQCGGGGAGGSIYITAGILTGWGSIVANGGSGGGNRGGGGAGGRIALYYTSNTFSGVVNAYGGRGYQSGSAGTIFTKVAAVTNGDLLVDNNNGVGAITTLPDGTYNFDTIAIRNKAKVDSSIGSVVTANTLITENEGVFYYNAGMLNVSNFILSSSSTITNDGNLSLDNITFDSGTLINNGDLTWTTPTFATGTNVITNNGRLSVPSLTITDFALIHRGTLNIADNTITIGQNGVLASDVYLSIGNLAINSGGVLTHSDDWSLQPYSVDINAVNLTVNAGGRLDVDEKGYGGQSWDNYYTGPGGASNMEIWSHPGGGGGYGGKGGDSGTFAGGISYGDAVSPVDLGSGGGRAHGTAGSVDTAKGGDGGGAIKLIVSNELLIDGVISADGGSGNTVYRYGSGGGSGGSIYIIANTITGSGNIMANGGNGGDAAAYSYFPDIDGGGGGGGRIAVYYTTSTFNGLRKAEGGTGRSNGENGTVNMSFMSPLDAPFTFSGLDEKSSSATNVVETLLSQKATASNVLINRDLNGTLNFTNLEFVTIKTGLFAGKGFFKGNWTATLEGVSYEGTLEGMFFLNGLDKKIYLKGVSSGGIRGITEGYLSESVPGSGTYDQYQSAWTLSRVGAATVSANVNLNGTINYQVSQEYPLTQLYTLQSSFEGTSSGHYTGPLSVVLTHVRVADETSPYDGEGFSVSSYVSDAGQGQGWTYDRLIAPGIVKLNGPLTSPLFGIADAVLDETKTPGKLFVTVERMDLGLPPSADLKVVLWGPRSVSPGQTINYIVEYRNDGVKAATEAIVYVYLDHLVSYVSATEGAYYDPYSHMVSWNLGALPAKSVGYLNVKAQIPWGLPQGQTLKNKAYISDIVLHSLTINEFLNGISYNSANDDLNKLYQEFTSLTDSEWTRVYDRTNFITGALEAYLASKDIRTGRNAVGTDDLTIAGPIAIGNRPHWIGYSGGATTLVNQAKQGRISGDVLYLISPQSVTQEDIQAAKAYFNRIIVYQGDDLIPDAFTQGGVTIGIDEISLDRQSIINISEALDPPDNQMQDLIIIMEQSEGKNLDSLDVFSTEPGNRLRLVWQDGTSTEFFTTHTIESETGIEVLTLNDISHTDWIHLLIMFEEKYDRLPASDDLEKLKDMLKKYLKDSSSESVQAIVIARDPNIKYGPEGDVRPGQKLDYKVEFENEGEGIAFGVYFIDALDEDLDDATLEIGPVISVQTGAQIAPAGTYDLQTRTVTWFVGEVDSEKGGYAKLSANVRADALDKSEIINFATVYFPSVPEATRTNGVVSTVILDITPPVTTSSVSPTPNAINWNNTDVTVTLTAQDETDGSGVKEIHYTINWINEQVVAGDTATISFTQEGTHTLIYWAVDKAGNVEAQKSLTVKLDKTAPVLTMPVLTLAYTYNSIVSFAFSAADTLSGLQSSSATFNGTPISSGDALTLTKLGANTFTLEATDVAGNAVSQSIVFNVEYIFSGFLPPVVADGSKVYKLGQTLPVKFQLQDANTIYVSTALATLTLQQFSDDTPIGDPIAVESTSGADTGNTFRYDFTNDQYIFNLNTNSLSTGTWQLKVQLDDGTTKTGFIKFK
jgi:hypothetical protein